MDSGLFLYTSFTLSNALKFLHECYSSKYTIYVSVLAIMHSMLPELCPLNNSDKKIVKYKCPFFNSQYRFDVVCCFKITGIG